MRGATLARRRLANATDVIRFGWALILIVLGALLIAESVLNTVTVTARFFNGTERSFEFLVGFIAIVLGATLIPSVK